MSAYSFAQCVLRRLARRLVGQTPMRSVYFHEDDYCQVEILPVAAQEYCLDEMKRIGEFAAAHRDGLGFTDVYMRANVPQSLASLDIPLVDLRSAIDDKLSPFDRVFTGYSSHRERCRTVYAWGSGELAALFAEVGDGDVIKAMWVSLYGLSADRVDAWCRAFASLPHSSKLVLADWNSCEVVPLEDEAAMTAYLRSYQR